MPNKEQEDIKLKDLLYKYLQECNNDISLNISDTSKVLVINKYRNMLSDIINVCRKRNRF